MFYLLPAGIASSSRLCCPPGWTDPQWSPAGTGERHRSPQIPDRAPGTHLHLQSIPQCIPVAQILGREQRASCLLTPSIFVAEVREPPHVAQTDDISTYGQEKLHLTAPVSSLLHLGLLVFGCTCFIHHPPKLCLNQIHCVQIFFAFIFIPNSVSCNEQLPQLLISSRWKLSPGWTWFTITKDFLVHLFLSLPIVKPAFAARCPGRNLNIPEYAHKMSPTSL